MQEYRCTGCAISLRGDFQQPRLARLPAAQLRLAEAFILAGGNLKGLAQHEGISYPTLRKRVDDLIAVLAELVRQDDRRTGALLDAVERGTQTPEHAARLIKEINGGA